MPPPPPLLVDTNVILEGHRTGSWVALTGRFPTATVEECVTETQTGFQQRRPEQRIDEAALRSRCAIHAVTDQDRAEAFVRDASIAGLDPGERDLWCHALTRTDAWILCGPDAASLRVGVRLGFRDRLVSLERLLSDIGHRPNPGLRQNYTEAWLTRKLSQFVVEGIRVTP